MDTHFACFLVDRRALSDCFFAICAVRTSLNPQPAECLRFVGPPGLLLRRARLRVDPNAQTKLLNANSVNAETAWPAAAAAAAVHSHQGESVSGLLD
jgi:hypothetical protein